MVWCQAKGIADVKALLEEYAVVKLLAKKVVTPPAGGNK